MDDSFDRFWYSNWRILVYGVLVAILSLSFSDWGERILFLVWMGALMIEMGINIFQHHLIEDYSKETDELIDGYQSCLSGWSKSTGNYIRLVNEIEPLTRTVSEVLDEFGEQGIDIETDPQLAKLNKAFNSWLKTWKAGVETIDE